MGVNAKPWLSTDRKKWDKLHLEEVYMKLLNESRREKEWGELINVLHKHIGNVTSLDVPKDPFLKALRSYDERKQLHSWKGNRINGEWWVHERQIMTWFQLHFFLCKIYTILIYAITFEHLLAIKFQILCTYKYFMELLLNIITLCRMEW